jgi:hypothetical protein
MKLPPRMDPSNGTQPQMNPPSRDFENVTKDRRATADELQTDADKDSKNNREWTRMNTNNVRVDPTWTLIRFCSWLSGGGDFGSPAAAHRVTKLYALRLELPGLYVRVIRVHSRLFS